MDAEKMSAKIREMKIRENLIHRGKALEDLFDYRYYVQHVDETFKRVGV